MNTTTMTETQTKKLKRALWLAFQASRPMGMGFLHTATAAQLNEDSLYAPFADDGPEIRTDYVAGRMMKTTFRVSEDGRLTIHPEEPRHDYQSWAVQYPHAQNLINAVEESFH